MLHRCLPAAPVAAGTRPTLRAPLSPLRRSVSRAVPKAPAVFRATHGADEQRQQRDQALAAAAEQLGKAAVEQTQEALLGPCTQAVELLQRIATSNDRLEAAAVTQALQWAMSNAELVGEFSYTDERQDGTVQLASSSFVRRVLAAFMKGQGVPIPDAFHIMLDQGHARPQHGSALSDDTDSSPASSQAPDHAINVGTYVTPVKRYASFRHAAHGPLAAGKYGLVTHVDDTSLPYKVTELATGRQWWYEAGAVRAVPKEAVKVATREMHARDVTLGARVKHAGTSTYYGAEPGGWGTIKEVQHANMFKVLWDNGDRCWVMRAQVLCSDQDATATSAGPVHPDEEERQAFRQALADHIHQLTGITPRIALEETEGAGRGWRYKVYKV